MKEVHLFINDRPVTVPEGTTILDAARSAGVGIPTLCYYHNIGGSGIHHTPGSCRVCLVEVENRRNLAAACSTPVAEGMRVHTDTPRVADRRKTILELQLSAHEGDCEAPCTMACPAHAEVEEYVRMGGQGLLMGALKIIKKRIPLPMTIGRVCPRFCEKQCRRNLLGEPVAINEFKRTAADICYDEYMEEIAPATGKKVAIVGGGPAGLTAAYYLTLEGVACTVFEAMPKAGGMARYAIPEYRLPKATLDRELAHFDKLGIQFVCNYKVGAAELAKLRQEFDAVILTVGCWKASGMHCEGEELAVGGIHFLRNVIENNCKAANPGRVLVVGGGNTAMDCLRTAVRLGSPSVKCLYRRTEAEMPAEKIEIKEAREEGVEFCFLTAPVKLEKRGNVLVMTCQKMELGEPDASGRRRPVPVAGSEFEIEADTVIGAIGQATVAPEGVAVTRHGDIATRENSTQLEPGLYAAGDCVSGARTMVEAVAMAHTAAWEVMHELLGKPVPEEEICVTRGKWQDLDVSDLVYPPEGISMAGREELKTVPAEIRRTNFAETTESMTKEQLAKEARRCISCSCAKKRDCDLRMLGSYFKCDLKHFKGATR